MWLPLYIEAIIKNRLIGTGFHIKFVPRSLYGRNKWSNKSQIEIALSFVIIEHKRRIICGIVYTHSPHIYLYKIHTYIIYKCARAFVQLITYFANNVHSLFKLKRVSCTPLSSCVAAECSLMRHSLRVDRQNGCMTTCKSFMDWFGERFIKFIGLLECLCSCSTFQSFLSSSFFHCSLRFYFHSFVRDFELWFGKCTSFLWLLSSYL